MAARPGGRYSGRPTPRSPCGGERARHAPPPTQEGGTHAADPAAAADRASGRESSPPAGPVGSSISGATGVASRRAVDHWQEDVNRLSTVTTMTPRAAAPTITSWPFSRAEARMGPTIGSRIGIVATRW